MSDFRENFWELICGYERTLYLMQIFVVAMLLLALFSLAFIPRDSAAFVVLQIDFVIFIVCSVLILSTLYVCRRRRTEDE